jgi:hypothetical protein
MGYSAREDNDWTRLMTTHFDTRFLTAIDAGYGAFAGAVAPAANSGSAFAQGDMR